MEFGAAIWPFQWTPPYEDGIKRLAKLGFKNVELIAWDRETLDSYYTPERIRSLKQLVADQGMTISEFVHSPAGAADPDATRRRQAVEGFKRACDVAVALGTGIINSVVPTPFGLPMPRMQDMPLQQELSVDIPRGLNWAEGYDQYVDTLRQLVAVCAQNDLRYALEMSKFYNFVLKDWKGLHTEVGFIPSLKGWENEPYTKDLPWLPLQME
ncbi:MAG TPA: TIM barrel protein, partial [Chloroflexota bacterium]|nr:TIM barrel protein [Chloroflexota bacterium]